MSSVRSGGGSIAPLGPVAHNAMLHSCHAGGQLPLATLTGRTHLNRVESHCKAVSQCTDKDPADPWRKGRRYSEGLGEELMGPAQWPKRRRGGAQWPRGLRVLCGEFGEAGRGGGVQCLYRLMQDGWRGFMAVLGGWRGWLRKQNSDSN